jgi:hypothetical protein
MRRVSEPMLVAAVSSDPANGILLVTVRGRLTVETAPIVRTTLLKCLAEAPDAVLVDVSRVNAQSRPELAVFPAALRAVDAGRGHTSLLLFGARPELAALMRGRLLGDVRRYDTFQEAMAAVTARATAPRRRVSLAALPTAPAQARAVIAAACRDWGIEHVAGPANQVISELVSNAVQHAGPGQVHLTAALRGPYLYLSVWDGSARTPVPAPAEPAGQAQPREGGRGLFLVDVYATAWGSSPTGEGKTVWASLRTSRWRPGSGPRSAGQLAERPKCGADLL